jgi:hypothetical protein
MYSIKYSSILIEMNDAEQNNIIFDKSLRIIHFNMLGKSFDKHVFVNELCFCFIYVIDQKFFES